MPKTNKTNDVQEDCRRCGFTCNDTCTPLCAICDNETLYDLSYDQRGWPVHSACLLDEGFQCGYERCPGGHPTEAGVCKAMFGGPEPSP